MNLGGRMNMGGHKGRPYSCISYLNNTMKMIWHYYKFMQ